VWLDPVDLDHDLAGVLSPVEGGRWIVTLGGAGHLLSSSDEAGFAAALGKLRSPLIAEALAHAEPLGPVFGNRETANRFRHYERWPARLPGFVALGDSACKFNPVYGQGMTTAAMSAELLGRLATDLDVGHPDLPRKFFRAQAMLARDPWTIATAADFRFPATTGARPPFHGPSTRYMDALFAASAVDPALRRTLGDVIHMLRSPNALFAPATVLRVLRARLVAAPRPLALDELAGAHAELAA
jgi:2-polyprenyl-6-methoxyphenol hydroxylase-like FAD-dependent oxidoreductase